VLNSDVLGFEDITLGVEVLLDLTVMHVVWVVWCECLGEFTNLNSTLLEGSCGFTEASIFAAFSNYVSP